MEDAEASFLSVRKIGSGTDEYQLFLGQVSTGWESMQRERNCSPNS
jgi:hypothetical protein